MIGDAPSASVAFADWLVTTLLVILIYVQQAMFGHGDP